MRRLNLIVAGVALCVSLMFCFVLFPLLPASFHGQIDPDKHGALGFGLWKDHTLSYHPDKQPTVERGPVYPAFVALTLAVTGEWYPQCVQAGQCVLFALQCLLVFWIAETLWSRRAALIAGLAAACQPYLVWYLSRLRLEIPTMFLFTCLVAATLHFAGRPSPKRAVLLGLTLGVAALCRGTLLSVAVIIPILLGIMMTKKAGARFAWCALCVALLVVLPWTLRNWRLTHTFIPVHVLAGVNMQIGDVIIDNYSRAPFSFDTLWSFGEKAVVRKQADNVPEYAKRWQWETARDRFYVADSLARYRKDPGFLARKLALGSVLFWVLGESKSKSLLISVLDLPVLLLFVLSAISIVRSDGPRSARLIPVVAVALVYLLHLPVVAYARYSVILIPVMLAYAAGPLDSVLSRNARTARGETRAQRAREDTWESS